MDVYKTQTRITCAAIIGDIMDADERRIRALYFSGMYTLSVYDSMATFA
jgi:hypothetical protein